MRKIVYIAIMAASAYFAGIYRSSTLISLFSGELILLAAMLIMALRARKNVSAAFQRKEWGFVCGTDAECAVLFLNSGRIAISRVVLKLVCSYDKGREEHTVRLTSAAAPGESLLRFDIRADLSGLMHLRIDTITVSDMMSLFSLKARCGAACEIAVFPAERRRAVSALSGENLRSSLISERTAARRGDSNSEIRQLREYQEGDPMRYIHWNQTARSGEPWVKEFEDDSGYVARLIIDTADLGAAPAARASALYEAAADLIRTLLDIANRVMVCWYDGSTLRCRSIADERDIRLMLLDFYRTELPDRAEKLSEYDRRRIYAPVGSGYYRLGLDLRLYFDDVEIGRLGESAADGDAAAGGRDFPSALRKIAGRAAGHIRRNGRDENRGYTDQRRRAS